VMLVALGIIILVVWFTGPGRPRLVLFPTETPTVTNTATNTPVTPTLTFTSTITITVTSTVTETPTPSGPFEYTVLEDDNCWGIAQTYNVDLPVLLAINNFPPDQCPIIPGQKILIPAPGQVLPTDTPIPTDIAKGTKITYIVKTGDTLAGIASRFNSTIEEIIRLTNEYNIKNKLPEIKDAGTIFVGETLIIPVQIATPTVTRAATSTSNPPSETPKP
jgi:LysM repeat protein